MDARHAIGEVAGQHPEPGADLQHDVVRPQLGQAADDAEDVLVDEEMLAELTVRDDSAHGRENAALAFASICAASSSASSSRAAASASTVWTTFAGSFGLPRGLRREVRAVGLGEKPIGGDARGALAQIGRLRVGDVAGERDVVAAFERGVEQRR